MLYVLIRCRQDTLATQACSPPVSEQQLHPSEQSLQQQSPPL